MSGSDSVHHVAALQDLIARLEKATGADRELDADIWAATWRYRTGHDGGVIPILTASIDAALTLVPNFLNRRWYAADSDDRSAGKPVAAVYHPGDILNGRIPRSVGVTPAIALCIAALKARSAIAAAVGDRPADATNSNPS